MRRPLKPFVTEYKGGRRPQGQPPLFGAQQTTDPQAPTPAKPDTQNSPSRGPRPASSFDGDWPRPKSFDAMAKPESDDAYEAAMRAADALFTRPDRPREDPQTAAAAPARNWDAPQDAEEPAPRAVAPERGGRILQAIDEPPPPQFAALEAAYAPKRRGRKPGSKNKPKVPALATSAPEAALPATEPAVDMLPAAAAIATPAVQQIEAIEAPTESSRAERRTPWARDRVKPGEGWKRRRLPRVCW